jgi:Ca2+-binding EF-hand superfamily protein
VAVLGFPDDKSETGYNPGSNSLMPRYGVHVWLIIPIAIVVFRQLPIFTRQISLLVGVLHLHEEAANKVIQHMEVVKNIRRRIKLRLEKTKIIKGKKKLKKGMKQLALIENGEFQILSTLKHQDEADAGNETRLTRKEIQALLDQYKTETADKQLAAFMDRDAFKEYLQEPKQRQQTAQTAKTMLIAEGQGEEEDSITLRELVTFLVRAIAYACNIADEHGVQTTEITRVRDNVVNLSTVTEADFEEARLLARTKSLFRVVDSDKSGKLTRSELHRAFRKYR